MSRRNTTPFLSSLLAAAVVFGVILSCDQSQSSSTVDVLVTVNGTPIGEEDVLYALTSGRGHQVEATPAHRKNVLEGIMLQEILYQRAVELGLDTDPTYQKELRRLEAQMNAFKRKTLSDVFLQREIAQKAEVSDAEARLYFATNAVQIRTEVKVWQILRREEGLITQALNDLEHGTSFEEVAGRQFPPLPTTDRKPWDLGYLRWHQVPKAWWNVVYDLKPGARSDIIRGPNKRFWIIKLIDKRENPDVTYEDVKPTIMDILRNDIVQQLRDKTIRDLQAKARIVYAKRRGVESAEP